MHTLDTVTYLVDLLTAKNHLEIASSVTDSDSSVIIMINGVSKWFENKTDRILRKRAVTEYRDGNNQEEMYANEWPVDSAALSVYIDSAHEFGDDTKVAAASMIVDESAGLITLIDDIFTRGTKTVKLSYSAGFAEIPYDLQQAALMMIDKLKNPAAAGASSISLAGGNVAFLDTVAPKFVLDVIERYHR